MLSDADLTNEDLERLIAAMKKIKAERQAELAKLQAEVLVLRAWNIAHGLKTPPPQES